MYQIIFCLAILLQTNYVKIQGFDSNSFRGRRTCYDDTQDNCNERFIDVYPHLSRSVSNMTDADTFMLLYTRKNPEKPEKLHKCGGRLPPDTNFNAENELIVILTPFTLGFCDLAVYREWIAQFLIKDDFNILVIDYNWGTQFDYWTSVLNARTIVKHQVIILLQNIQEQTGIPNSRMTFLAESLGAQLAGMIGHDFHIRRIIGLDPAGPAFNESEDLKDRLDKSDADLVEIWHTSAGDCLPFFGINYSPGHVNFWINGGHFQPFCTRHALQAFLHGDFFHGLANLLSPTTCSHTIATKFFSLSINAGDCQFVGVECDGLADFVRDRCRRCGWWNNKCLIMGFDTEKVLNEIPSAPKKYYVKTTESCDFCDDDYVRLQAYRPTYESTLESNQID